jgi:gliding motility-associated-like protein
MRKQTFILIFILLLFAGKVGAQCNVVITNPAAVCSPATVDITSASITSGSTPGLTFTYWTDASALISYPTPTTATDGTYYIKGDNGLGCFEIKPVNVTVTTPPVATFNYQTNPYCSNEANPSPTFTGGGVAGTFSSSAGLVFVSTSTGKVNLAASTPGTYTVTNTIAATGGCGVITATSSITITKLAIATFDYATTPYCSSEADPVPTFLGGGEAGTFSSTGGLVFINTSTGQVDLTASTPGSYTVTNTIAATGGCGIVTATAPLGITKQPVATFSYPTTPYCSNEADPSPVFSGGGVAGTFSSTAGLVFINTSTGQVDLTASTPGSYTVTNTIAASGACGVVTATSPIAITKLPVATFSYTTTPYCSNEANPLPTFSGGGVAGTFSSTAGLVFVSAATGQVNLAASTPGTYTVTNTITASGACGAVIATSPITITKLPVATFSYTTSPYCPSEANPLPTFSGGGVAGTFSSTTGLNFVSTSTGQINLGTSTAGTYTVTNTIAASGGCGVVTATGTVTITPNNSINRTSATGTDAQSVCLNTAITNITYATIGATGATVTGLPSGVTGSWASNVVTISGTPVAAGVFSYTVTLTGGCGTVSASGTITVNALPVPTLTSSAPGNVSCLGTNVTFTATGGTTFSFRIGGVVKQTGASNIFTTNLLVNGNQVDVVVTNAAGCTATSPSILCFVNQPPFIFITTPATCSIDLATYSLAVTVSTGTVTSTSGVVTNAGSNVWTITGVLAGANVTVKVTDSGGCENSLVVTAPNCSCPVILPPVSGGDKSYCATGIIPAINATVLAGETVDWYSASSAGTLLSSASLSYTPTAAGTYYALARNTTTNCVSTTRTPIVVTMNPLPIPTLTSSDPDNIFCAGTSVIFTAAGGTGFNFRVGGVSVQSGALSTYTNSSLTNGQIVDVIVTSALGCTATSAGITNTVNPLPVPTLTSSDADNTFCIGTSVTFTAGGGTNYNFRVAGTSVQNGVLTTYTTSSLTNGQVVDVIVTNANGCAATSAGITNSVYTVPTADAGTGGNNCGLSYHLNASLSVGTGTWSKVSGPGNVTFSPDANTATATATVTAYGSYTFKWTVVNGTCSTSANITIVFIQQPPANAGLGGNVCDKSFTMSAVITTGTGTWTMATGPGNATFAPDIHQPAAKVTVDKFGSYGFAWTVVNSTCTSSDIINVAFHDLPSVNAGKDTIICKGNSIHLYAQGTGTVSWTPASLVSNPNIINPVVTPDTTTTFTINLTDQFGCKNSDNIVVQVRDKIVANAGPDQLLGYIFETNMAAVLNNTYETGAWSVISGTGEFADSTSVSTAVTGLSAGDNDFLWIVKNGYCPASNDTVRITVNNFVIPTLITPNMDGRNDYFVIRGLTTLGKTELVIFDRRGAQVYKNMNYDNSWNGVDYNKNPLPEDTYFYVLKAANGKSLSGYIVIRR